MDFVDSLIHSFENGGESGSEDGDGDPSSGDDTAADFIENLMCLAESLDSDSESDTDFIQQLVLSYESGSDTSDVDPIDHALNFMPYTDHDSTPEEEMEFPQPLYDNAPLSDLASRQAIMHFALANHLFYAAVDQLLALLKIHLPSSAGIPRNSSSLRRRFVDGIPLQQYYCWHCFTKLNNRTTDCRNRECQEVGGGTCYFVPVSIAPHLKQIFSGKCRLLHAV